ncbi:MAG: DEAD/DEAH box helicase [Solobacterium sp.]|nr:DEAD/DEAH box helicase [Solobacterium sp.]
MEEMKFLFTPEGFIPDITDDSPVEIKNEAFAWKGEGAYNKLYEFGAGPRPEHLTPSASYLYTVSSSFFKALTELPELEVAREKAKVKLSQEQMDYLLDAVPFGLGAENITAQWIKNIYKRFQKHYKEEIKAYPGTVEMYLSEKNQDLHVPERIFFHLVEQNKDPEFPFAFMATYASRGTDGKVHHYPLRYALTEYKAERRKLLELLSCLNKAAEVSELIADFMKNGELFHPLRLTAQEAFAFLKDIDEIEKTGILCRIPNWWRRKVMNPALNIKIGAGAPSLLGFDSILETSPSLTIDGVELTEEDIRDLLNMTEGLAMLKGKWIVVDHARLKDLLKRMESSADTVTLLEAMRKDIDESQQDPDNGVIISNGQWLNTLLNNLRHPEKLKNTPVPESVHANLRPYQKNGYAWLNYMDTIGFGACLADDMGLGKTLQVLTYLEQLRSRKPDGHVLLVVPASLLGNWQKEQEKFAPDMPIQIIHGLPRAQMDDMAKKPVFLNVTTYGMAIRLESLREHKWDTVILDEAQAIKNPLTKQTKTIKLLDSRMRIAMTGTPIENDLTNLWSLFDFLNKGLLGSAADFSAYCKKLDETPEDYAKLKAMVNPFLLRRMKTDKRIIKDLPEKFETIDYADLSKKQVVLYKKTVDDMARLLEQLQGMERRGVVLAAIMKLKQICNHPDQYLGTKGYTPSESGKFEMLKEICETIYEKRERVIVFTQFKEITEYLSEYLETIFHTKGAIIHGGIPPKQRTKIVEQFQSDTYMPFIVCSVKAAGTGLNLTKANHVIHFDRWWNPAVENQATDRAFRIGQTKNVMVHKLVSKGTIEEKIDMMIESKKELAENVIGEGSEKWITELSNDELLSLLRLD